MTAKKDAFTGKPKKEVSLKIINSPLIPKPKKKATATEKAAKKIPEPKTIKAIIKEAEEEQLLLVISKRVTYDINWILIRRKFIALGRIFRRKDKLVYEAVKPEPLTQTKVKRTIWRRYCDWFNKKFNHYPDTRDIEELCEA